MKIKIIVYFFLTTIFTNAIAEDAIVGITSNLGSNSAKGTGFFVSDEGDIFTTYHVIQNAKSISVFYQGINYKDITVASYNTDYDFAHLKINNSRIKFPYYYVDDNFQRLTENDTAISIGYLSGIPNQTLRGEFTSSSIKSGEIRQLNGNRMFDIQDVDLLPLNMTIYGGLSGSPVIVGNSVVGILSGSFNQGGSFTWAIPVSYRSNLLSINLKPHQINKWPELSLMNKSSWKSTRKYVKHNNALESLMDDYFSSINKEKESHENALATVITLRSVVKHQIYVLEELKRRINPATNSDKIFDIISSLKETMLIPGLNKMGKAFSENGNYQSKVIIKYDLYMNALRTHLNSTIQSGKKVDLSIINEINKRQEMIHNLNREAKNQKESATKALTNHLFEVSGHELNIGTTTSEYILAVNSEVSLLKKLDGVLSIMEKDESHKRATKLFNLIGETMEYSVTL